MKRYSIMAVESGSQREVEVFQVDANPKELAETLASKTTMGRKHLPRYVSVRIRDNQTAEVEA